MVAAAGAAVVVVGEMGADLNAALNGHASVPESWGRSDEEEAAQTGWLDPAAASISEFTITKRS